MVDVQLAVLPAASVALYVTIVSPRGKRVSEGPEMRTELGEHASVAVAVPGVTSASEPSGM